MGVNLAEVAQDKGIRYFLISFTDLFGVVRSKNVQKPVNAKLSHRCKLTRAHTLGTEIRPLYC